MRAKLTLVAVVLVVAAAAGGALAAGPTASRSVVLGKTQNYPASGCPASKGCEVFARVTGIQMKADGVDHPFRAPTDGQVVAWWLKLPAMKSTQVKSFSDLFGGPPSARLSILRRGKGGRVRLVRQSATEQLQSHLGAKGRARFKLAEPLHAKKGDYVGVTAMTWVPSFAVGLDPVGDSWLASRPQRRCNTPSSRNPKLFARYYRRSDAHAEASTVKEYRCLYRTARLLYWARLVPEAPAAPPADQPGR